MSKGRIIVCDDASEIRLFVVKALSAAGYEVRDADSGPAAVTLFQQEAPDVVVLDVMMPQMDGFETYKAIRALPAGPNVAIAFLTADARPVRYVDALALGINDFLLKPIRKDELLARVSALCTAKQFADELREGGGTLNARLDNARRVREVLKDPVDAIAKHARQILADPAVPESARAEALQVLRHADALAVFFAGLLEAAAKGTPGAQG